MGRRLFHLGLVLLLATVALWIAGAADMIPGSQDDRWSRLTLEAGMVCLAAALVLRIVMPIAKVVGTGRCAVCGHPTERGHRYCLDHTQEAVNAYRDRTRNAAMTRPRSRPPDPPPVHRSLS
ncbi:MAG TPA: hypothetical protein VFB67_06080 [Candidatus Polarisedimenticolaceae bacterium]|nr:hypothetical protein [Candidatus Polarisedimenticolaceae bacterium]